MGRGTCLPLPHPGPAPGSDGMNCNSQKGIVFCVENAPQRSQIEGRTAGDDALNRGEELDPDATDDDEYCSSVEGDFSDYEDPMDNDSCNAGFGPDLDGIGWNRVFRKKKVTEHWKKFIHPLMWRCKWMELRIKELQKQVARYDKELSAYARIESEEGNQLSQHSTVDGHAFVDRRHKSYHMKRRKIGDMVDMESYIARHVIFSYVDSKLDADGHLADEGFTNPVEQSAANSGDIALNYEWPLEIKGNDKFLEQILLDIESAQVRVLALKSQLGKVFCENATDFHSASQFIPGDSNYGPSLSPRCSPIHNGQTAQLEAASTNHYSHEFGNEDLVLSGSAVSSHGDAVHPDIIESTVDLLSSAIGNSFGPNQMGNLGADVAEDVLICNQAAAEVHGFRNVSHSLARRGAIMADEEESASVQAEGSSSETETDPEIAPTIGRKPTLRHCAGAAEFHIRRSKRKRKMRKSSSGEKIRKRRKPRKQGQR